MNPVHFDRLVRRLEQTSTRRTALKLVAGLTGTLVSGAATERIGRAADEVPPPPALGPLPWPVCSEERPHYCLAAFTIDGEDQLTNVLPDLTANVYGVGAMETDEVATSVYWSVSPLRDADLDREIMLRVRIGRIKPFATQHRSGLVRIRVNGSETEGWEVEVRGRAGKLAAPDERPADQEQATYTWNLFEGQCNQRSAWSEAEQPFEGFFGTSAFGWTYPEWLDGGWEVRLSGPHFLPGGEVNHASYCAWMPATSLTRMGLTLADALAGELTITRRDAGDVSPVEASLSEFDGGAFIEIPDLTFSSPTIIMKKRGGANPGQGGGGSAHDCPKRKVYKHGRCVKKHKKKGKRKKKR